MAMEWKWGYLDMVLVPMGFLLLVLHHADLSYRVWRSPATTVIGVTQMQQRAWAMTMLKDPVKNGTVVIQTLRNTMMASVLLATAALTMSSVIATLVSRNGYDPRSSLIVGDKGAVTASTKLLAVLIFFLIAFICNAQFVRYYSHITFLMTNPEPPADSPDLVVQGLLRASLFWAGGLRAFYFSMPMFLWMFGPLPMLLCSLIMVIVLHFSDTASNVSQNTVCPESIGTKLSVDKV